ncbi:hypothetical protein SAMN06269185_1405 [Natronoarchaeum philippinense]|uniref:Uncharacterized protein n=1 Tax=Natronoarchaeum philippinense TaxID=558529 RepID=A0A285NQN8_NATPI|nr:hypothetical protein [Natronoarchaeum philippinense]SNZ11830.1 hypothetical protein SAMN06269185_1405 [Natronoarchaeum philippinense]
MGERRRSAAASRVAALVLAVAIALGVATASVGVVAGSGASADGNVSAGDSSDGAEPRVLDASVHVLDDGQRVLVAVVEVDGATETVVTEIDGRSGTAVFDGGNATAALDGDDGGTHSADPPDELPPSIEAILRNASAGVPVGTVDGTPPNGSTPAAGESGAVDGSLIEWPTVPGWLRSPPPALTEAVSWTPTFGGGWLLPGVLGTFGVTMATLGLGALAVWRRTF